MLLACYQQVARDSLLFHAQEGKLLSHALRCLRSPNYFTFGAEGSTSSKACMTIKLHSKASLHLTCGVLDNVSWRQFINQLRSEVMYRQKLLSCFGYNSRVACKETRSVFKGGNKIKALTQHKRSFTDFSPWRLLVVLRQVHVGFAADSVARTRV